MIDVTIDCSHWQGSPDFERVKTAGVKAVIVKATQGLNMLDARFERNVEQARASGLMVGAYHFGTSAGDGADQARYFMSQTDRLGVSLLVLDFEKYDAAQMSTAEARAFIAEAKSAKGKAPGLYSSSSFLKEHFPGPDAEISECWLWVARYGATSPGILPAPWDVWTMWQYTQSGHVDGIGGPVDRNQFNGDLDGLRRLFEG